MQECSQQIDETYQDILEQQQDKANELFPNLLPRNENGNERATAATGTFANSVMLTNKGSGIANAPSFGNSGRQQSNMSMDGTPEVVVDGR